MPIHHYWNKLKRKKILNLCFYDHQQKKIFDLPGIELVVGLLTGVNEGWDDGVNAGWFEGKLLGCEIVGAKAGAQKSTKQKKTLVS